MKESHQPAQACVIWMHGLGADASDMVGVADQLSVQDLALRHLFINAPQRPVTLNNGMVMPAWYDIVGLKLVDKVDIEGILHSEGIIRQVMESQVKDGFAYNQLFLAGFSQGGAMALQTGLNTPEQLAGIIALSAYLPLGEESSSQLNKATPFFMGSGRFDPLVLPAWTQHAHDWVVNKGYTNCSFHQYSMEHSICYEEITDLNNWFINQLAGGR
ncbi:MAG: carboxylesterase [Legionella sp.]|jgi:phospholipase/carboxylesterase